MTKSFVEVLEKEQAESLIASYDNFLFDCDGVIWLDSKLIPGVLKTIQYLESKNKNVVFVTNNSSQSREDYVKKFKKLGFSGITKERIYPTCYAAASHLTDTLSLEPGSKVWVLGDHGIEVELQENGFITLGGTDERLQSPFTPDHELLKVDSEVKAVVVGSTKEFNYMRIASTLQYLLHDHKSLPFIGTNIDRSYPGPNGLILPAGGSVVHYMAYTAHRDFVDVGKPSQTLMETIIQQNQFERSRTLMVGDTLYTDIKFGNDGNLGNGFGSLLVLSGGTKRRDFNNFYNNPDQYVDYESMVPSFVAESLGHIIDLLD